jgi:hypothetical protein
MIVVRLIGGLGNQMFQYALGKHLALKHGTDLVVDKTYFEEVPANEEHFVKREYDLDIFDIKVRELDTDSETWLPYYSKNPADRLKNVTRRYLNRLNSDKNYLVLREKQYFSFDKDVLESGSNTYLIGYWQNEKYFKDIEQQIRQDFSFRNGFDGNVVGLANEISHTNTVCLNIRRGDFINNPTHGFVGMEYLSSAVAHMREKVDVQKLYVFSDEIAWCKDNLRFDIPTCFVSHNYAGFKFSSYLYLMTRCHHFIIPNSTFGWWGAWLSENPQKVVIAPKQWVNVPGLDGSEIIPDGWITI